MAFAFVTPDGYDGARRSMAAAGVFKLGKMGSQ
jgi:hypothetical protein